LKTKKWQIEAKLTWHQFGRKINWFGPKKSIKKLKGEAHGLENQMQAGWSNSRIEFASNDSKLVPRKLDPGPHVKLAIEWIICPCEHTLQAR